MGRIGLFALSLLTLLTTLVLGACKQKEALVPEKTVTNMPERAAPEILEAKVREDRLRVRETPYLEAEIVGYLMAGDIVTVESKTEWSQSIGNNTSRWYFVRTTAYSGWTYGAFLHISDSIENSISVDPSIKPPAETVKGPDTGPFDPAELPEILLPVFGLEGEPVLRGEREGSIVYDRLNDSLLIPFETEAESRLIGFVSGLGTLRIVLESSQGRSLDRSYSAGDVRFLSQSPLYTGGQDAIIIPFFSLATLDEGIWEAYAFSGDENWPAATGRLEIVPSEVSIVAVEDPDPLEDTPRETFGIGDRAWCYGRGGEVGELRQVALYHDTGETSENQVLLRPVYAHLVMVDKQLNWSFDFEVNSDIPIGRCWVAVGNPIENVENIKVFITSLERISDS